nr:immunoglobulin light chain junction region [Macaca mulatta]MOW57719.1 immunoglobulin light chain junction region [Macaca mulatta]
DYYCGSWDNGGNHVF